MSSVNDDFLSSVFSLMGQALTVVKIQIEQLVAQEPEKLRSSHLRLLSMVPADGIRPTDLAARIRMTKQSLGEFVDALQRAGYLQVEVDPADRRARIVTPTPKGGQLQQRIVDVFTQTEDQWSQAVGPRQWATFRKVLTYLAAQRNNT